MKLSIPAQHSVRFPCPPDSSADLHGAVRKTLAALDWTVRGESDDGVAGSIGINPWSWGERIAVRFLPEGDIRIESRCSFPIQLVDWGKNRRNVERFLAEFRHHV